MADVTYVTIPDLTAATDAQVIDTTLVEAAVVDISSDTGYSSRKATLAQIKSLVNAAISGNIATSASISNTGLITFKNSSNTAVFTLQLPVYDGGVS